MTTSSRSYQRSSRWLVLGVSLGLYALSFPLPVGHIQDPLLSTGPVTSYGWELFCSIVDPISGISGWWFRLLLGWGANVAFGLGLYWLLTDRFERASIAGLAALVWGLLPVGWSVFFDLAES